MRFFMHHEDKNLYFDAGLLLDMEPHCVLSKKQMFLHLYLSLPINCIYTLYVVAYIPYHW